MHVKTLWMGTVLPKTPSRRKMGGMLLVVWVAWCYANLGPNGIFYLALHGNPDLRIPGEILYYAGVAIVGIVAALHLARKWQLDLPLFPEKRGLRFWLGSGIFLSLAIFLGVNALADGGMMLTEVWRHSLTWIVAPVVIFVPTMLAYTILWYGLLLRGFERVFGGSTWATVLGILLSAVLYGLYHFASIDEIATLEGMIEEVLITTGIGIAFGIYVVLFRSLVVAFLVNWLLNWFVFTPVATFHPPVSQWPLGYLVLLCVWGVYRLLWIEKTAEVN